MTARPAPVRQADLARYLKAAATAGLPVAAVRIAPDGTVILTTGTDLPDDSASAAWDAALAKKR